MLSFLIFFTAYLISMYIAHVCVMFSVHSAIIYERITKIEGQLASDQGITSLLGLFSLINFGDSESVPGGGNLSTIELYSVEPNSELGIFYPTYSVNFKHITDTPQIVNLLSTSIERRDTFLNVLKLTESDQNIVIMMIFCYVLNNYKDASWTEWKGILTYFIALIESMKNNKFYSRYVSDDLVQAFVIMNSHSRHKAYRYMIKKKMLENVMFAKPINRAYEKVKGVF